MGRTLRPIYLHFAWPNTRGEEPRAYYLGKGNTLLNEAVSTIPTKTIAREERTKRKANGSTGMEKEKAEMRIFKCSVGASKAAPIKTHLSWVDHEVKHLSESSSPI